MKLNKNSNWGWAPFRMGNKRIKGGFFGAMWHARTALLPALACVFIGCHSDITDFTPILSLKAQSLAVSGTFSAEFNCESGHEILVRADQLNIDFEMSVRNDIEKLLLQVDSPAERLGPETLLFNCGKKNPHTVALQSTHKDVPDGKFNLLIRDVQRTATPKLVAAYKELGRAGQLNRNHKEAEWIQAAQHLKNAIKLSREAGNAAEEAIAEYQLACIYYLDIYHWDEAAEHMKFAEALFRRLDYRREVEWSQVIRGAALAEAARGVTDKESPSTASVKLAESERILKDAVEELSKLNDSYGSVMAKDYLAITLYYRGEFERATQVFVEVADEARKISEHNAQLMALQNAATIQYETGDVSGALSSFTRLVPLVEKTADLRTIAAVLHNLAELQSYSGQLETALVGELRVLDLQRQRGDKGGEARSLHALGNTYRRLGQNITATDLLTKALDLEIETNQGRYALATLIALGDIEGQSNRFESAIEFHRRAAQFAKTVNDKALVQLAIASDNFSAHQSTEALRNLDQVSRNNSINRRDIQLAALLLKGKILRAEQKTKDATAALIRARRVAEESGYQLELVAAMTELGLAYFDAGDRRTAINEVDKAISLIERIRNISSSPQIRAKILANRSGAYHAMLEILMAGSGTKNHRITSQSDRIFRALAIADSTHARNLLDFSDGHLSRRLSSENLERREQLFTELSNKSFVLERLMDRDSPDLTLIRNTQSSMAAIRIQIDALDAQIFSASESAIDGVEGVLKTIGEVKSRQHQDSCILEFSVGPSRSFVWLLQRDHVSVFDLGSTAAIEARVRSVRAELQQPSHVLDDPALRELKGMLSAKISMNEHCKNIYVVPDGPLQLIPMALLFRDDDTRSEFRSVVAIPSIAALARAPQDRPSDSSTDGRVAVFGTRGVKSVEAHSPDYLQGAQGELTEIAKIFGTDKVDIQMNVEHPLEIFRKFPFSRYSIVHIAGHAQVNLSDNELSYIRLSDQEPMSSAQLLRASGISQIKIPVKLVVLSACETGYEQFVGDGLTSFAGAFLSAGAESVVVSLWKIPDSATSYLMQEFYSHLAVAGTSPQRALALAQMRMKQNSKWAHLYYWAGFQIVTRKGF